MGTILALIMISIVIMFLILVVLPDVIGSVNRDQQIKSVSIEPIKPEIPVFISTTTTTTIKPKAKRKPKAKPKAKVVAAVKNPIKRKK